MSWLPRSKPSESTLDRFAGHLPSASIAAVATISVRLSLFNFEDGSVVNIEFRDIRAMLGCFEVNLLQDIAAQWRVTRAEVLDVGEEGREAGHV